MQIPKTIKNDKRIYYQKFELPKNMIRFVNLN